MSIADLAVVFLLAGAGSVDPGAGRHARDAAEHTDVAVHPDHAHAEVAAAESASKPCAKVVGFLPYWSGTSNIRWDLLTHVACFSVEVDGLGNVVNARGWPWTATINTARANNVRVLLTVTNFTPSQLLTLLQTPANRARLTTNLRNLTRGTADGVCLDFEGSTSNGWAGLVDEYAAELRAGLRSENPAAEVWVATPAVNWNGAWNLTGLAQAADGLFIMGYDFYGSFSSTSGPSSPLIGGSFNLTNTVTSVYGGVLRQNASKVVLGVPWYGNHWRTTTSSAYATATAHVSSPTFASANAQAGVSGRLWDAGSRTPWTRWQASGQWNQMWYDDAESLGLKYDLAKQYELGGVGMWAMGYQGSGPSLWSVIEDRFVSQCPCPADLNGDGVADLADFFAFFGAYDAELPAADVNRDGTVDLGDFFGFFDSYDALCGL